MSERAPRFSIVSAVYNVEQYLPKFLASLDAQTIDLGQLELIFVDDGSTDQSQELVERWASTSDIKTVVLTKENGGPSSARNFGIPHANGEWITFADPDDSLAPDYFEQIDKFDHTHPGALVLQAKVTSFYDDGQVARAHSRERMFEQGDALIDIDKQPDFYPYSAATSFFRTSRLKELGLEFDGRIRPGFEDVHLLAKYIMANESRKVGFVASAIYYYRRRGDGSSLIQSSNQDPDRFLAIPKFGYLDLLKQSTEQFGSVPIWLQHWILGDLNWYFRAEERLNLVTAARGEIANQFIVNLREIAPYFSREILENYRPRKTKGPIPEIFLYGLEQANWHSPYVVRAAIDKDLDQVKLTYRFSGKLPKEKFLVDGRPARVVAEKIRSYRYFEHDLLFERIVWLKNGLQVEVNLDGQIMPITDHYRGPNGFVRPKKPLRIKREPKPQDLRGKLQHRKEFRQLHAGRLKVWDRTFNDSWIISDRLHNASDSGEVLFKYLQANRPDINSCFLITKGTPDYDRLVKEGYGKRLISPGSVKWWAAMVRAKYLISTHAPRPLMNPPELKPHFDPKWKFVFLQHGVIDRDMSTWLNQRDFAIFATSTQAEYDSIAGDHTPYKFTTKETKLTGLPRFDAHLAAYEAMPPNRKNLILIAPTWRHWLAEPLDESGKQARQVVKDFLESDYIKNWLAVVKSPVIAEAANEAGLEIGFLMHPNLRTAEPLLELPPHVTRLSFQNDNPQEFFARTKFMVTDYSAVAFDVAYLGKQSVYFQFDRERVEAGGNNGKLGYYDYDTMGFGPVAHNAEVAVANILAGIQNDGNFGEEFRDRIKTAFPVPDGRCTERVITEIERLSKP